MYLEDEINYTAWPRSEDGLHDKHTLIITMCSCLEMQNSDFVFICSRQYEELVAFM